MTDPLTAIAIIIGVGVGVQWLGNRVGIPSILLLLAGGIIVGPVTDWIQPDELFGELLFPSVSLGVGLLLFEGGLALHRDEAAEVGHSLARLVTIGAVVTWVIAALSIDLLFDVRARDAWLIGAVLVVSGPTVVLPLLRLVNVRPTSASLLKWEGILIDPIGALLAVVVLEAILGQSDGPWAVAVRIIGTLGIGAVIGFVMAMLIAEAMKRHWIPDRLHNAVMLMAVVVAFVGADATQAEAGLTATTIMGIVLANQKRAPLAHIITFQEDLSVLVLGGLFIVLGARVDLDAVVEFLPRSLALLAVLIVVARPLAVWASTLGTGVPSRDRWFVSSMAPRGIVAAAVASLFALELEEHGQPVAELVPVVFTVIVGSVVFYSIAARVAARVFQVARAEAKGVAFVGGSPWVLDAAERLADLEVPSLVITSDDDQIMDAIGRGLLVYTGRIESEDLALAAEGVGVGLVLALATSHDVNDLAVLRFSEIVGRAGVFSLPQDGEEETSRAGSQSVVARRAFGDGITHTTIDAELAAGSQIRRISHEARPSLDLLPLLVVNPDGSARVADDDERVDPGEHVIGFVRPRARKRAPLAGLPWPFG